MTTHTDTSKLTGYQAGTFPSLGNEQRFIATELAKLQNAINALVQVAKLLEQRMNSNNLT